MELTEEQQMIRDTARRFVETELKPIARDIDKNAENGILVSNRLVQSMGNLIEQHKAVDKVTRQKKA